MTPDLFVVETDTDAFIGRLSFHDSTVAVHNGFVGHPTFVDLNDMEAITLAQLHPLVEDLREP